MRFNVMVVILALTAGGVGEAAGQGPRDVGETFLELPLPQVFAHRPVLARLAPRLDTRAERQALLELARSRNDFDNVVDARNGYFTVLLPRETPDAYENQRVVLTYFVRADGGRLVVLQLRAFDSDADWPGVEDYFWTISPGGSWMPVNERSVVPALGYAEFWGDEPRPAGLAPDFFMQVRGYEYEWPREGTTARLWITSAPPGDDEVAMRLADLFERRRNTGIDLLWDRRQGRFTRGELHPYEEEGEHDHH